VLARGEQRQVFSEEEEGRLELCCRRVEGLLSSLLLLTFLVSASLAARSACRVFSVVVVVVVRVYEE
jgi:hypothetical protein